MTYYELTDGGVWHVTSGQSRYDISRVRQTPDNDDGGDAMTTIYDRKPQLDGW